MILDQCQLNDLHGIFRYTQEIVSGVGDIDCAIWDGRGNVVPAHHGAGVTVSGRLLGEGVDLTPDTLALACSFHREFRLNFLSISVNIGSFLPSGVY